ncbi:hypothetical protein D9619_012013 [Psilocybe cf. subviscida]|uniref:C2H2-type domain-containing protein n=1 Tax=Psilocybe cf. subviscida TaxID=2480587 RepID=A0A8H5EZ60_9AGAR|nr:hypothetical protein D9619_012013 [Psilocybe cf. subviscida]
MIICVAIPTTRRPLLRLLTSLRFYYRRYPHSKHTGERPFSCHCSKQFSRLDNLRQHAQTVHADKAELNEQMMRELTSLHAVMSAANTGTVGPTDSGSGAGTSGGPNGNGKSGAGKPNVVTGDAKMKKIPPPKAMQTSVSLSSTTTSTSTTSGSSSSSTTALATNTNESAILNQENTMAMDVDAEVKQELSPTVPASIYPNSLSGPGSGYVPFPANHHIQQRLNPNSTSRPRPGTSTGYMGYAAPSASASSMPMTNVPEEHELEVKMDDARAEAGRRSFRGDEHESFRAQRPATAAAAFGSRREGGVDRGAAAPTPAAPGHSFRAPAVLTPQFQQSQYDRQREQSITRTVSASSAAPALSPLPYSFGGGGRHGYDGREPAQPDGPSVTAQKASAGATASQRYTPYAERERDRDRDREWNSSRPGTAERLPPLAAVVSASLSGHQRELAQYEREREYEQRRGGAAAPAAAASSSTFLQPFLRGAGAGARRPDTAPGAFFGGRGGGLEHERQRGWEYERERGDGLGYGRPVVRGDTGPVGRGVSGLSTLSSLSRLSSVSSIQRGGGSRSTSPSPGGVGRSSSSGLGGAGASDSPFFFQPPELGTSGSAREREFDGIPSSFGTAYRGASASTFPTSVRPSSSAAPPGYGGNAFAGYGYAKPPSSSSGLGSRKRQFGGPDGPGEYERERDDADIDIDIDEQPRPYTTAGGYERRLGGVRRYPSGGVFGARAGSVGGGRSAGGGYEYGSESRPQSRRLSVMELCNDDVNAAAASGAHGRLGSLAAAASASANASAAAASLRGGYADDEPRDVVAGAGLSRGHPGNAGVYGRHGQRDELAGGRYEYDRSSTAGTSRPTTTSGLISSASALRLFDRDGDNVRHGEREWNATGDNRGDALRARAAHASAAAAGRGASAGGLEEEDGNRADDGDGGGLARASSTGSSGDAIFAYSPGAASPGPTASPRGESVSATTEREPDVPVSGASHLSPSTVAATNPSPAFAITFAPTPVSPAASTFSASSEPPFTHAPPFVSGTAATPASIHIGVTAGQVLPTERATTPHVSPAAAQRYGASGSSTSPVAPDPRTPLTTTKAGHGAAGSPISYDGASPAPSPPTQHATYRRYDQQRQQPYGGSTQSYFGADGSAGQQQRSQLAGSRAFSTASPIASSPRSPGTGAATGSGSAAAHVADAHAYGQSVQYEQQRQQRAGVGDDDEYGYGRERYGGGGHAPSRHAGYDEHEHERQRYGSGSMGGGVSAEYTAVSHYPRAPSRTSSGSSAPRSPGAHAQLQHQQRGFSGSLSATAGGVHSGHGADQVRPVVGPTNTSAGAYGMRV